MIVVDCSAIIDALVGPTDDVANLRQLLGSERLSAPTLLDYEVVSALKGLTRAGRLEHTAAIDVLGDYADLTIGRWGLVDGFRRRAFELSAGLSSYDAAYVVLAEALDATLVTRDRKLAKAARELVEIMVI